MFPYVKNELLYPFLFFRYIIARVSRRATACPQTRLLFINQLLNGRVMNPWLWLAFKRYIKFRLDEVVLEEGRQVRGSFLIETGNVPLKCEAPQKCNSYSSCHHVCGVQLRCFAARVYDSRKTSQGVYRIPPDVSAIHEQRAVFDNDAQLPSRKSPAYWNTTF